tara:strand:- start:454 stop:1218 length:765 start_codon:yes stop_codon:yes gene_type:complete
MNVIFHDKPFKLTKENYPLGDTFHVIDNYLSEELHRHWDKTLVRSNLWSKTNQVSSDSKTGLPHHSFWGGTFFRDSLNELEWCQGNQINKSDTYFARYFNTRVMNDFGFRWVTFDYMGLNSQTQGLDGTCHNDCAPDCDWNLSFLYYLNQFWNPNWGGDLRVYNENIGSGVAEDMDKHEIGRIEFKPNRLLLFDGRIPHGAEAPKPSARYVDRRSCVLRGSEIRLLPKEEERREVSPRKLRYQRYADHRVQNIQ